jgi:hypothetical protein
MTARQSLFVLFLGLLMPVTASAQDDEWRSERSLASFYDRTAEDLRAGKPLVITAHYGMWHVRADQPERNLNWGVYYGHARMMKRAASDAHIRKNYRHTDWKLVFERQGREDPIRTLVFTVTVTPNETWRTLGVAEPFPVYLVMHAYADQEAAALAATSNLRQDEGEAITLDDGTRLDTGAAQATGYFGHNFFYDYADFEWDGFDEVKGAPGRPKGVFAVGCKTGRVPGFDAWYGENVNVLLYSRTLMASEGYSTLALADGLIRHLDGAALADHANDTYRYFQKLSKPDRRVGKPFVSHADGLFD